MKRINPRLLALPLFETLAACLNQISIGKVRHIYALPDFPDHLLVVASDRISIFDFVLNASVRFKGAVLTAMTVDWLTDVFSGVPSHLVAHGASIDAYLPETLRGNADLQSRAMVVKELAMLPVEFVVRGFLMGSGLKSYKKTGKVCGIALPQGLVAGSEFDDPIFTPTTKAEDGHDQAITFDEMVALLDAWLLGQGSIRNPRELAQAASDLALGLYSRAKAYADAKGIKLLDTKFEFGLDRAGNLTVGDEVLTPDSSRFSTADDYRMAMAAGKEPKTSDKQYVRNLGMAVPTPFCDSNDRPIVGINNLDPEVENHADFVAGLPWPEETMEETTGIYLQICGQLTGLPLVVYQQSVMGIEVV